MPEFAPVRSPTRAPDLAEAYAHCAGVVRASGSSFASAFWMFPRPRRRALHAVYAFCRLADDIADDPAVRGDRGALLERWAAELREAYHGTPRHPVTLALADAARRYDLPEALFQELLEGVAMDLDGVVMKRFEDLHRYCHCVASTVGLLVVRILGVGDPRTLEYADTLGIAVQLTNILRDVGSDAAEGRIYLPREDMSRMGVTEADLQAGAMTEELRLLLALYAERARLYYERAANLLPPEQRWRLRPAEAMGRIYRDLLEQLQARGFPCLGEPLRLPRGRRVAIAAAAWVGQGNPNRPSPHGAPLLSTDRLAASGQR